jgi:hypothetical protein
MAPPPERRTHHHHPSVSRATLGGMVSPSGIGCARLEFGPRFRIQASSRRCSTGQSTLPGVAPSRGACQNPTKPQPKPLAPDGPPRPLGGLRWGLGGERWRHVTATRHPKNSPPNADTGHKSISPGRGEDSSESAGRTDGHPLLRRSLQPVTVLLLSLLVLLLVLLLLLLLWLVWLLVLWLVL